jgi:hypothetical protein
VEEPEPDTAGSEPDDEEFDPDPEEGKLDAGEYHAVEEPAANAEKRD